MRKLLFVIAGGGLALALAAPVVVGDSDQAFTASLNGYLEVPSISTTARGSFRAEVVGSTINYRLVFRDLSTPSLFSHIHFARPDVNGGISAFLCGGGGKPACPTTAGTVTGTIVATRCGPDARASSGRTLWTRATGTARARPRSPAACTTPTTPR